MTRKTSLLRSAHTCEGTQQQQIEAHGGTGAGTDPCSTLCAHDICPAASLDSRRAGAQARGRAQVGGDAPQACPEGTLSAAARTSPRPWTLAGTPRTSWPHRSWADLAAAAADPVARRRRSPPPAAESMAAAPTAAAQVRSDSVGGPPCGVQGGPWGTRQAVLLRAKCPVLRVARTRPHPHPAQRMLLFRTLAPCKLVR